MSLGAWVAETARRIVDIEPVSKRRVAIAGFMFRRLNIGDQAVTSHLERDLLLNKPLALSYMRRWANQMKKNARRR